MTDNLLRFLVEAVLVSYMANTWLTIVWKVFGNGRFK